VDVLERIRKKNREPPLDHGDSVRIDLMAPFYRKRYGKPLTAVKGEKILLQKLLSLPALKVMADPQLRAMTRSGNRCRSKTFLAFAIQHLDDKVEFNPTSEGSDTLTSGGAFHLLGAGGAARLPDVQDPTTEAATLLRIKREIRELLLNHGGSVLKDTISPFYLKRYGKLLTALGVMADPKLLAMMTNAKVSRYGRTFRGFAVQHLEDVVMHVEPDTWSKPGTYQLVDSYAEEDEHVAGVRGSMGATSTMSPEEVSKTLWAWGLLSETWTVDEKQVSAVNGDISRVTSTMTTQDACRVLSAWGKLAASGLKITSMLGEADMDAMFARVGELEHQMSLSQKHLIDEALELIRTASSS